MPKKPKKPTKLRPDVAETAYRTVQEALGERPKTKPPQDRTDDEKDPEAVKRGSQGGQKGGPARAKRLSAERKSEIAQQAAEKRWRRENSTND